MALGGGTREERWRADRAAAAGSAGGTTAGGRGGASGSRGARRGASGGGGASRNDTAGGSSSGAASGSSSVIASGSSGVVTSSSGLTSGGGAAGGGGTRAASILVLINTLLDGVGNTGRELVGNILEFFGDLGADSLGKLLGSSLLLLEGGEDLATGASLDNLRLLGVEVVNDVVDLIDQVLDRASETKGLGGGEILRALGGLDTVVDSADDVIRGRLDGVGASAIVGVNGTAQVIDLAADRRDNTGHGSQVALNNSGLADNTGGSGEDTASKAEGQQGEGSKLHFGNNEGSVLLM